MNWIVQKFDELKARLEAHIPITHQRLESLERRVAKLEAAEEGQSTPKAVATP